MTYYKDMSSNYGFQPTLSGLNTIESDSTTSSNIVCDTIQINQSGTAPTMPSNDNSDHIATTAFVTSHASGTYVTLGTAQTITGEKTFTAGNTFITGNLVCNKFLSDNSGSNINIGTNLFTGDIFLGNPTGISGQNTALNWGTTSNSGQLTFRGGSFTLSSTGNYTQQSGGSLTTSIDTNKTTGAFNMLTGTTWSGNCNIGTGVGATGNINIGGAITKTYLSGNVFGDPTTGILNLMTNTTGVLNFGNGTSLTQFNIFADASFNGSTTFSSACPTTPIAPTTGNMLCNKTYVDSAVSGGLTGYVDIAGTQTITGEKTFQNIAINQLSGNVDLSFNSNTQRFRIRRPTNSIDFNVATNVSINTTSTTGSLAITAGVAPNIAGLTIYPTGGLGEGAEIDMQAVTFFAGNVWIDSNAGLKSFSSNNIKYYNPISYSYDPTTITWGTPSANTINGWTNAPTNTGDTYTGTASDTTTPANVGQIVLPAAGIWFIQVSVLITLNTGSDTITDRTIVVSDVGTTSTTPCTVGFAYRDPINDGAGSAGNRQQINFSGIYHHVSSTGSKTLYINAIVITSGSRTVTVSGNYKFTRIG